MDQAVQMSDQFDFVTKSCIIMLSFLEKAQYQEAQRIFDKFNLEFNPHSSLEKLKYFAIKNELLYRSYQYDILEISLTEAHELMLNFEDTVTEETNFWYYHIMRTQAFYYHIHGSYRKAIHSYVALKEIAESTNMQGSIGKIFGLIGEIYYEIGDFEKALESYKHSLTRLAKVNNFQYSAYIQLYTGMIYEKRGDFNEAKNCYEISLQLFNKSEVPEESYKTKMRIGYLQLLQGEVDQSIEIFNELRSYAQNNGFRHQEAELDEFLGLASMKKNQYDEAVEYLKLAYQIKKKAENPIDIAQLLFHLISAAVYAGKSETVDELYSELSEMSEKENSPIMNVRKKLVEASLLKDAPRLYDKVKAQQIYEEIVNDSSIEEFDMKIIALINLCELLVFEIKNSNDEKLLTEAYSYIDQIHGQAQSLKSTSIKLEANLLKSKFLQCEFKFNDAISLLEDSKNQAHEYGLIELEGKIELQVSKIMNELEKWNDLSDKKRNINERIEEMEVKEYLNDLNKILRSK